MTVLGAKPNFPWGDEYDRPLSILFSVEPDAILDRALSFGRSSPDILFIRRALMYAALTARLDGHWVSVSFARDFYTTDFLHVASATYRNVVLFGVKALADEGLLSLQIATPQPPCYPGLRWRSRYTLSDQGLQICRQSILARRVIPLHELRGSRVRLFDRHSHAPLVLPGTERQAAIHRHLTKLTEATSASVTMRGDPGAAIIELPDPKSHGGKYAIDTTHQQWVASYLRKAGDRADTLMHSGRPSGHFAQNVPRRLRDHILIDGSPIAEVDIQASHPSIMAAKIGVPAIQAPYEVLSERAGIDRRRTRQRR